MTIAIVVSILVPIAAAVALFVARNRLPGLAADMCGIALQTVIVIVVLLAIAGAVAGVLLSRGGEVVSDLESANVGNPAPAYRNATLCAQAGHSWNSSVALDTADYVTTVSNVAYTGIAGGTNAAGSTTWGICQ